MNLADLVVSRVTAPAAVDTEAYFNVGCRLVDQGVGPAGSNWVTHVYLSDDPLPGNDGFVGQLNFAGTVPAGLYCDQTLQVRAPIVAGQYWVVVTTNTGHSVPEVLEDNNTAVSAAPVLVQPAYRATVETDVETTSAGTPVPLRGRAYVPGSNASVPYALVNLHFAVHGTHRIISALTDADGNYTATFTPLRTEAGHCTVGADHPGLADTAAQDEFSVLGFGASPTYIIVVIREQSSATGTVAVTNWSELPLTGLQATVVERPAHLTVTATVGPGAVLAGHTNLTLAWSFTANDASVLSSRVIVRVSSAEGASVDVPFYVAVEPLRPQLLASPASLLSGMARGRQRVVEFDVANLGGLETRPITLSLPAVPWLHVASTNPLPSLAPGTTNRAALLLTPAADLPLGPYTGSLVLLASNASLVIPFEFRALSEARGDLTVMAVDEYTYYAQGAPKVTNAAVAGHGQFLPTDRRDRCDRRSRAAGLHESARILL